MNYALGIDVGTSYTAAAVWRPDGRQQNKAEVVPLGNRAASVASVLFLGADGSVVVGEAAQRRALSDPDRVVREFKRRIGDDTPLFVGGAPHAAHDLAAMMVRWVVDRVAEREGGPADRIAITHPASWGPYKKDLLRTALEARGLGDVTFLAEPEAAAISYASMERVEPDSTIAVYDLGGGTFDAAVVRKTDAGSFTLLGAPDGLEYLGGADFDEAVFAHVQAVLSAQVGAERLEALDVEDPNVLTGLARLRRECTEAKETLSADTEVSIPVLLPGISTHVRLVRSEFEEMIRPDLQATVDSLSRALRSAGVTSEELRAVLLVGGSSRMPLVSQMVSAELGCPVVVDADPKTTIALGAALALAISAAPATPATSAVVGPAVTEQTPPTVADPTAVAFTGPQSGPPPGQATSLFAEQRPAGFAEQMPTEIIHPERPPVSPNGRGRAADGAASEDGRPNRRKLVTGLALTVTTAALVAGALLIPAATTLGDDDPAVAAGSAEPGAGDTARGAMTGLSGGDSAKMSITGAPNTFRGRDAAHTSATPTSAPATSTAGSPSPAPRGAHGGRVTTPAPAPSSTPHPTPGPSTTKPPPGTTNPPPSTTNPPPPEPTSTTEPPPEPTSTTEPPPPEPTQTSDSPPPEPVETTNEAPADPPA